MNTGLSLARAVADAVLYEGYLLYPYRATSQKNQSRWQFGILGPPGAAATGVGEDSEMFADALLHLDRPTSESSNEARVEVHLRFLHLQSRTAERVERADFVTSPSVDSSTFIPVNELVIGTSRWLSWDEAAEVEVTLGPFTVSQLERGRRIPVEIPAGEDHEWLRDEAGVPAGRLVRRRVALHGEVSLAATIPDPALAPTVLRLRVTARNTAPEHATDKQDAIATSFIGAHMLLSVEGADFLSLVEPPGEMRVAAEACEQHRCWPVLAGPEGQSDVLLLSPIILYDHPTLAPQSSVALYDSTEIDEILTLRVLTLTEEEKAQARSTDPRAAEIIDRCEAMTPEEMQQLHGVLLNPHAADARPAADAVGDFQALAAAVTPDFPTMDGTAGIRAPAADLPWWTPEADYSVQPDVDVVMIGGVPVSRGSRVKVVPSRRADAQDLFFAGRAARVTSVHFDVDGSTHVGLVLEDDPAADLYDGYGRSFYFAPDELEPLPSTVKAEDRKETPS